MDTFSSSIKSWNQQSKATEIVKNSTWCDTYVELKYGWKTPENWKSCMATVLHKANVFTGTLNIQADGHEQTM